MDNLPCSVSLFFIIPSSVSHLNNLFSYIFYIYSILYSS